jgi:alkylated DNA repair protein alkB family protein 6
MMRLDEFRLNDIPGTAFYIPDFIGEERENFFLGQIERTPRVKWTQLQNRRLMNLGGVPRPKVFDLAQS